MKTGLLLFVVMMASIGWSAVSVAQPLRKTEGLSKVSPELWKKTQEAGTLRVIVDLNVPGWTSKPATQQAELTQQQMISDTQEKVIAELTGTRHKITTRFYIVPGMGLEVEMHLQPSNVLPMSFVYLRTLVYLRPRNRSKSIKTQNLLSDLDVWRKPDVKRGESFTIITTKPNELVRTIHNRMPVILQPEDEELWLDPFANTLRRSQVAVEALSRRADGRSRCFTNRQLGEVRWTGVHQTCFG